MTYEQQLARGRQISAAWQDTEAAAGKAINWVEDVRSSEPRLDNEADAIVTELRRLRNHCRRFADVAKRPMTAGFFGLSQAGKSYLISALAAGDNGKLETVFDGERLDFIDHINPPGGGKEATGLVTRFCRSETRAPAGCPLELRLFRETEIAKILLNAYINDFDDERRTYELTAERVRSLLESLQEQQTAGLNDGLNADEIVDLQDYAEENFEKSLRVLKGGYWLKAAKLAPQLSIAGRAQLFSILWGEIPEFTAIYEQFAETISRLGKPEHVYAPLSAVVQKLDSGAFSQADSIMNVDMLNKLNSGQDRRISVRPVHADGIGGPVDVSQAELAMLTAEIVFPLVNTPRVPALQSVDLLDFPGYRGRYALTELSEVKKDDGSPVAQLLLRGKVAYLFERYTDSQEMNILIVCTPSDKQSDVNSVGPVLKRWIDKTQGSTASARAQHKPGLLWAITMFDKRIGNSLQLSEENLKQSWGRGGLMQQTILERFGTYEWHKNWADGKPFNNVFLVRKPGMPVPFLDRQGMLETSINANSADNLQKLYRTFSADADIQHYIRRPEEAWEAMMRLNDGGMSRISSYLQSIADLERKNTNLSQELHKQITHITDQRLRQWYVGSAEDETAKKFQLAQEIRSMLFQGAILVGELQYCLQLPESEIRNIYLTAASKSSAPEASAAAAAPSAGSSFGGGFGSGFGGGFGSGFGGGFSAPAPAAAAKTAQPRESAFAKNVYQAWLAHLRGLGENTGVQNFFSAPPAFFSTIADELISGANRHKLLEKMSAAANENEGKGSTREQLADLQASAMKTLINDFIAWLGMLDIDTSQRPARLELRLPHPDIKQPETRIFAKPKVSFPHHAPELNAVTEEFALNHVTDWLQALELLIRNNAGHSTERNISPQQNEALGIILQAYQKALQTGAA